METRFTHGTHSHRRFARCWVPLAAIAAAVATASCGSDGGGNGSDAPTPPPPPPPPAGVRVTGTAAKGLLGNALVSINDVSANGTVGSNVLATTRTDAKGLFSASVSSSGPVVVTVTTDAQSTMLDELSGAVAPAPANLTLRTALAGATTTPFAVTPLTDMAFAIASAATGGLTVANIDAGNSAVSAALLAGAPVLLTQPIDLATYRAATVAEQAQAKLLTAIAVAAQEGFAVGATGTSCSEGDYNARLVCTIGGMKGLLTSGAANTTSFSSQAAYLVSAYDKLSRGLVNVAGGQSPGAIGLSGQTTAEKALSSAVSEQAVLFGYNASASPLVNTKALFADLRTTVVQLGDGKDVFGITPLIAEIRSDYDDNVMPVLTGTRAVVIAAHTGAGLIEAATAGSLERRSGNVVCGYDPAGMKTAANVALCRYGPRREEQILLAVTRSAAGEYAVTTQPLALTLNPVGGSSPGDGILDLGFGAVYSPSSDFAAIGATFKSNLTAGGAQSASWKGPFYVAVDGGRVHGDLSASQSDDWNSTRLSGTLRVGGTLSDGAGGIALAEATIGADSKLVVRNAAQAEGEVPAVSGELSISRLATASFVYTVRASLGEPVIDKSGTVGLPQSVAVAGTIARLGAAGAATPIFSGSVGAGLQGISGFDATQPSSATNSLVAQAQVVGDLALSNGRVLAVSITANGSQVDPTPEQPHSLSATYAYSTPAGVARINISGKFDATQGYTATVTTNSGVTATLARSVNGKVAGTVTANGVATATIDGTTINYSDGTTESVF
ncbi:MAG: hypothetical protein NDI84_00440 [Steroidobacteraceae bacterium]|nr:hypothetical protein [Steroidobacteraceae bacterium]